MQQETLREVLLPRSVMRAKRCAYSGALLQRFWRPDGSIPVATGRGETRLWTWYTSFMHRSLHF